MQKFTWKYSHSFREGSFLILLVEYVGRKSAYRTISLSSIRLSKIVVIHNFVNRNRVWISRTRTYNNRAMWFVRIILLWTNKIECIQTYKRYQLTVWMDNRSVHFKHVHNWTLIEMRLTSINVHKRILICYQLQFRSWSPSPLTTEGYITTFIQ